LSGKIDISKRQQNNAKPKNLGLTSSVGNWSEYSKVLKPSSTRIEVNCFALLR
jgi:hypothetical protein